MFRMTSSGEAKDRIRWTMGHHVLIIHSLHTVQPSTPLCQPRDESTAQQSPPDTYGNPINRSNSAGYFGVPGRKSALHSETPKGSPTKASNRIPTTDSTEARRTTAWIRAIRNILQHARVFVQHGIDETNRSLPNSRALLVDQSDDGSPEW